MITQIELLCKIFFILIIIYIYKFKVKMNTSKYTNNFYFLENFRSSYSNNNMSKHYNNSEREDQRTPKSNFINNKDSYNQLKDSE